MKAVGFLLRGSPLPCRATRDRGASRTRSYSRSHTAGHRLGNDAVRVDREIVALNFLHLVLDCLAGR